MSNEPASPTPTLTAAIKPLADYFAKQSKTPLLPPSSSLSSKTPQTRICGNISSRSIVPYNVLPAPDLQKYRTIQGDCPYSADELIQQLKSIVDKPGELAENLRLFILASSIHDRMHRYKLSYFTDATAVSTTPVYYCLNDIPFGTATNERLTNQIYLKKLYVKGALNYTANGHSGASYVAPVVQLYIYREKLAKVVGSSPPIVGVDANPPVADLVYTQLGYNGNGARLIAQRSPADASNVNHEILYHKYLYTPEPLDFALNGNSAGNVTQLPFQRHFEIDVPCHNMQCVWGDDANNSGPFTNVIWLVIYSNVNPAGGGFTWEHSYCIHFEDAPSAV